jgi:hypothetical protein
VRGAWNVRANARARCVHDGGRAYHEVALSLNDFAKHRGKLTNRRAQYKMLEQKKKI